MTTILLAIAVGIVMFIFRYSELQKHQQAIHKIMQGNTFERLDDSKPILFLLLTLFLITLFCLTISILQHQTTMIAFSCLLAFLFLSEMLYAKEARIFYYNTYGCILNQTYTRYKNIKSIQQKHVLLFSKYTIITHQNQKFPISSKVLPSINVFLQK